MKRAAAKSPGRRSRTIDRLVACLLGGLVVGCGGIELRPPSALPSASWLAERAEDPWLPAPDAEDVTPPPRPRPPRTARRDSRRAVVPPPVVRPALEGDRDQLAGQRVAAAQRLLGRSGNADRPFVDEVLHAAGQGVAVPRNQVYAVALHQALGGRDAEVSSTAVRAGDLAFFRDTLDLNGNRRPDDGLTLVALVERVEADRVLLIARRAGRVRRLAVSTSARSTVRTAAGRVVNTRLVRWPGERDARTTGECLAAFVRP